MKKINVKFILNGVPIELEVQPNHTALRVIREQLDLTGAKEGCGAGECGACTIIVDGLAVNSCLMLAPELDGKNVLTVEGLAKDGKLTDIQQAFIDHVALQCGYCTPGFIMSTTAFLEENKKPNREEIEISLSGNLCRCTGYKRIIEAVEDVVSKRGGK
ncbi:MAG: (2Fe-2S)-binding protein [Lachnospiraceae bacterium]|nr:(2Fe-2S)-binding protein [Lachnospiraceae bacterium]